MNEQSAREYVSKLRRFYTDALIYVVVNLGLILIWAIAGGGTFWPIWVIVGWGIGLGVHAFSLGLIPQINGIVPFMTDEWEEAQIRHLIQEKEIKKFQAILNILMSQDQLDMIINNSDWNEDKREWTIPNFVYK